MPKGGNGGGGGPGGGGGGTAPKITGIGDTVEDPNVHITDDRTLTLWGTSEPNTTVVIYLDGSRIGTTTSDGSGNWSYTTDTLTDGSYDFTAETGKGKSKVLSDPYTVEIDGANTPPVATDDSASTNEDSPVIISVLANDSDADGNALNVTSVGAASNGTVTLNGDGTITYNPFADFSGTDSFTYTISDNNGGTDTATVTVTVDPVNDAPIAGNDSATIGEDTTATINVLANDTDPDGDLLTVSIETQGSNGTATVNPDKTIDYTPDANFSGQDSFTYRISDGNGGSTTATVTVTVNPVNDAPAAADDSASTSQNTAVVISVLANDSDPDGDSLLVIAANDGSNGTVGINPDGTLTYTPNAGFSGQDSFTYTVSDGNGGQDIATVTVNVSAGNAPPVATDDSASTNEDSAVIISVLANDTDPDGDTPVLTSATTASNGTVTLNGNGTITYNPFADWSGTDSFSYTISDGNGGTDTATVTVTVDPVNDAPTTVDDSTTTAEDTAVSHNVLSNDSDIDGGPLTLVSVADPAHGSVTFAANGTITYTPDANWSGTDTVQYTVSDGTDTSTGVLTVTVDPVNDAPTAGADSISTDEDTAVTISVLTNDSDPEGDTLIVTDVSTASNGSVTNNGNGTITYTPNANWSGTDSFTYDISDGNGGTDTATVTVTVDPVNDAPTAGNDSVTLDEDTTATISVLANDSDPDGDQLTVSILSQGSNGTATANQDGTIDFTPDADFNGGDSFTYQISDGNGGTATATVTVTVNPTADPPNAVDDSASTDKDTAVIISVLANDTDPDGDTLSVIDANDGSNGTVSVNGDGTLTYNPNAGFTGIDSFTYTVSDGNGGQDTATVTVNVTDSPPPAPDSFTPTDPIYAEQWHLAALGDIERIWAEFTGEGVSVGIYDDGIEYTHVDLDDNYNASKHIVYNGGPLDPYPTTADEAKHGTAVAGVIAGEANGVGTVGVAFDATLTGVNIFSGTANVNASAPWGFNFAIKEMYRFDVLNHSWGPLPAFINDEATQTINYIQGAKIAAETGRGNLGSLIVKSAGNWADNANGDATLATRHTIAVAAYDSDFDASWYTNRGANLLVSAPSSGLTQKDANGDLLPGSDLRIATTDRDGTFGYAADSWSSAYNGSGFGGTSSSAPTTAGVIALMLDANEGLGWRDVQSILAYSARHIGGDIGVQNTATEVVPVDLDYNAEFEATAARPIEYFQWDYNGADNWNGGGLHFSHDYGYGALDAYSAVRMAEVWTLFAPAQTSANEFVQDQLARVNTAGDPSLSYNANHANGEPDTVSATWTYTGAPMDIEYVNFSIQINLVYMQGVTLTLTSPEGTTATLLSPDINDYTPYFSFLGIPMPTNWDWSFGITAFKGEDPTGDWTFTIQEVNTDYDIDFHPGWGNLEGGEVNWYEFDFYGTAASSDDVFHYTDEVFETLANEPGRLTLIDNGGNDWLDMAAMTGDLTVNLATNGTGGASAAPGGAFIDIEAGTQIENAVTGDGDDLLTGNSAANRLAGMRGDDEYWGLGGNDTFIFFAGGGQDIIWDFDVASTGEVIELHGFSYSSFGDLALVDLGGTGTLIDLSLGDASGDQITLAGVNYLDLGDDDFVFV